MDEIYMSAIAESIRRERDRLLQLTDKTQLVDAPYCAGSIEGMQEYRQKLRDLPDQEGFPYDISFPIMPMIANKRGEIVMLQSNKAAED